MCGICGYISKLNVYSSSLITSMMDEIAHRGPDDSGAYMREIDGYQIAFGHRRLSIVDLSSDGHQPMTSHSGRTVVVYNGEIFNYQEIKRELSQLGHIFKTKTDTEVIIAAYETWGIQFVDKLNGMFAIALFDQIRRETYLIRDRMGVKPIYYYWDGQHLGFASELKPLLKLPFFKKQICQETLNMFLVNQYISGMHCIYKDTFKVMPGQYLCFSNGELSTHIYWDSLSRFQAREMLDTSYESIKTELEDLLTDAINIRLMGDVPVGMFLSGGVDSSLIAALASKGNSNLQTFSIGFHEQEYDEAPYAKSVAEVLGCRHHEEYCSIEDAKKLIFELPKTFDEPFADNSQLPTMMVSRVARKNVTVALSGDAGDELFCGYSNYDHLLLLNRFVGASKYLPQLDLSKVGSPLVWKAGKIVNSKSLKDSIIVDYKNCLSIAEAVLGKSGIDPFNTLLNRISTLTSDPQEMRMLLDTVTYLPEDILKKVDHASMAFSLEARTPFLDYRVVDFSYRIPHQYKYKDGEKKIILKDILKQYVPEQLIERPKKGFGIPVGRWLKEDFKNLLSEKIRPDRIKRQGLFNHEVLLDLQKRHLKYNNAVLDNFMWAMLMFQLWHDEYIRCD